MSRRDDELLGYIVTGLQMIARGAERALRGNDRFWAYDEEYVRRRRPTTAVPPAGPPEVVNPLIERVDRAAGEHAMAYEALLTAQEVADFLGLQRVSVLQLAAGGHLRGTRIGNRVMIQLGELRRYLDEGPAPGVFRRQDWRPLVEEFPGRRKLAEVAARQAELRAKYDAVFVHDLGDELGIENPWPVIKRMERKGVIESFCADDYPGYSMVKRTDLPAITAYIQEERERRDQRRAERAAQKKEQRITL